MQASVLIHLLVCHCVPRLVQGVSTDINLLGLLNQPAAATRITLAEHGQIFHILGEPDIRKVVWLFVGRGEQLPFIFESALIVENRVPLEDILPAIRDLVGKSKQHLPKVDGSASNYLVVNGKSSLDFTIDLIREVFSLFSELVKL